MKRLVFAMAALFISATMMAQQTPTAQKVTSSQFVKFEEMTFNFGKIKQGQPVTHEFLFKNVSKKPIVVETATASCGCTTPSWPQAPVAKGKTDTIKAGFNAMAIGPFNKTITVKIAGVDQPVTLRIVGDVLKAEDYAKYIKEKDGKSE